MSMKRDDVPLERGEVLGRIARTMHLDSVSLIEARYEALSSLAPHIHVHPMFVFVARGNFDERFDARDRTCGIGRLIYRPPGERHSQRFLARGAVCLTIELPSPSAARELEALDGRVRLEGVPALTGMRLYDELAAPTLDTPLVVEELIAMLIDRACAHRVLQERRPPRWLATARDALEDSMPTPPTLESLAESVGVHRVHLSRTFRRFYGCGVGDYVRRLRVHAACARLRDTAATIGQIACETGFSDQSHMGRVFRQVMRRPSSTYRERSVRERLPSA